MQEGFNWLKISFCGVSSFDAVTLDGTLFLPSFISYMNAADLYFHTSHVFYRLCVCTCTCLYLSITRQNFCLTYLEKSTRDMDFYMPFIPVATHPSHSLSHSPSTESNRFLEKPSNNSEINELHGFGSRSGGTQSQVYFTFLLFSRTQLYF